MADEVPIALLFVSLGAGCRLRPRLIFALSFILGWLSFTNTSFKSVVLNALFLADSYGFHLDLGDPGFP
jgi:hypothetical protein